MRSANRRRDRTDLYLATAVLFLLIALIALSFAGNYAIHKLSCGSAVYFNGNSFQCPVRIVVQPR